MVFLLTSVAAGQSGSVATNTFTSIDPTRDPRANSLTLKQRIDAVYELSVGQCSVYMAGDEECIKDQFHRNYRWEIAQDQPRWFGAPGIPGGPPNSSMMCPTGPTGPSVSLEMTKAIKEERAKVKP